MAGSTQRREYDFYQAKDATLFFIEVVMIYNLCINDKSNQTQTWWMNFLLGMPSTAGVEDIAYSLKQWGARVDYNAAGYSDVVTFDREEDMTMFLLRWS